jgi:hypothetical protein
LEEKGAGANVSHSNELIDAVGVSGFCPASASLYWSVIVHAHMDVEIKRKISSLSLLFLFTGTRRAWIFQWKNFRERRDETQ